MELIHGLHHYLTVKSALGILVDLERALEKVGEHIVDDGVLPTIDATNDRPFFPKGGGEVEVVEKGVDLRLEVTVLAVVIYNTIICALRLASDFDRL